ncbi:MAG: hypothetical protein HGA31_06675 [Candidatus Moranbacteria bacterium]|nr:hypothetical protein [Candidatus Moranbacteria bacterium]
MSLGGTIFSCPEWEGLEEGTRYRRKTCGWIEPDNGFMFISDEDMRSEFCSLFGIGVPPAIDRDVILTDFSRVNDALSKLSKTV